MTAHETQVSLRQKFMRSKVQRLCLNARIDWKRTDLRELGLVRAMGGC